MPTNLTAEDKRLLLKLLLKTHLQRVVRDHIRPLGICATSEKQGGQRHETGFRPEQAAASFFVTLTVDGQNRPRMNTTGFSECFKRPSAGATETGSEV